MKSDQWLINFVIESNRIEGYHHVLDVELQAHEKILACEALTVPLIQEFVTAIAPGHVLRDRKGLDVRVGEHIAPSGGPKIKKELDEILTRAASGFESPHEIHLLYEFLHPFTDGNGRSGRAIWLWMMDQNKELKWVKEIGFLHNFYYQTLAATQ